MRITSNTPTCRLTDSTSSSAQCTGTRTISNAGDATAIASCKTWSGDIVIATGASDDIALDGVQRIQGSLTVKNVDQVSSLSGDSLSQIDDTFTLENVQILSTLNFPSLTAVDVIDWTGLPNLQGLSLTAGLQLASTVSIQNTALFSLEGINVQSVDTLVVASNVFLKTFSMQVESVSTSLLIEANGETTDIDFPNLVWAYNMTFQNCSTINVVSLIAVNGSAGFSSNYFNKFQTPVLSSVGGTLSFHDNPQLSSMAMLAVENIGGGLQIMNNEKFTLIYGFENLASVGGNIDIEGPFTRCVALGYFCTRKC